MTENPAGSHARVALAIDARRRATADVDPTTRLLGMSLASRLAHAARKVGFAPVSFIVDADRDDVFRRALAGSAATGVATEPPDGVGTPLAVIPANLLGETGWLGELKGQASETGKPRGGPMGIRLLGPNTSFDARDEGAPIVLETLPMVLRDPSDVPSAERRLLKGLIKATDGFMSRHVERRISLAISRRLAPTGVTPNQMTLFSIAVGVAAGPFFLSAAALWQTVGALLFLAHSILDGCDGELARMKFLESRLGGVLDFWGDNIVHGVIFACMSIGWSRAASGATWPLALGALAVLGTFGSAGFIYWHTMRPKQGDGPLFTSVSNERENRFTRLLDTLARRDFIFLVLALALFGKASWFLALTALGAPIFFVLLIAAA